jgi:hypothetical protein
MTLNHKDLKVLQEMDILAHLVQGRFLEGRSARNIIDQLDIKVKMTYALHFQLI